MDLSEQIKCGTRQEVLERAIQLAMMGYIERVWLRYSQRGVPCGCLKSTWPLAGGRSRHSILASGLGIQFSTGWPECSVCLRWDLDRRGLVWSARALYSLPVNTANTPWPPTDMEELGPFSGLTGSRLFHISGNGMDAPSCVLTFVSGFDGERWSEVREIALT